MAPHSLGNRFQSDSSGFASLVFSVHPCQDFPLDHCGIISLVGHLRGEGAAARRPLLRKEGLTRRLPCVAIGPCGLHRNSTFYLTRLVASPVHPSPSPSPHLPARAPASLGKGGGCLAGTEPELETSSCELGSLWTELLAPSLSKGKFTALIFTIYIFHLIFQPSFPKASSTAHVRRDYLFPKPFLHY